MCSTGQRAIFGPIISPYSHSWLTMTAQINSNVHIKKERKRTFSETEKNVLSSKSEVQLSYIAWRFKSSGKFNLTLLWKCRDWSKFLYIYSPPQHQPLLWFVEIDCFCLHWMCWRSRDAILQYHWLLTYLSYSEFELRSTLKLLHWIVW